MKIKNTYDKSGIWLTGSLHNHTTNSACGKFSIDTVYDIYSSFDFFAISDHDKVTPIQGTKNNQIILKGIEVSSRKAHMLLIQPSDEILNNYSNTFTIENYMRLSNECIKDGGISILCHPNRSNSAHWSIEEMLAMEGVTGLEVMSGCRDDVELDPAFDKWDILLSAGRKVWGFGNDDFHVPGQSKNVWNVALVCNKSEGSILESFKEGSFYVSTGFGFEKIVSEENRIKICFKSNVQMDRMYKYVTLFGRNGQVLFEKTGVFKEMEYTCTGDEGYVRIAAYLEGGYGAFSQPIFIEK